MKRVVLDTNVVISAILWTGVPRKLFDAARAGDIAVFTSIAMLAELADVIVREKFAARLQAIRIDPDVLVAGYAALASIVQPKALAGIAPDPDDDVVIATALAARADTIVTGDRPFLSVAGHQNIRFVTVSEALTILDGKGA